MGFVRVSGYNQTDLDAAYARGVSDGESFGYDDGAAFVTNSPIIITAKVFNTDPQESIIIPSQWEDVVDIHIYNHTSYDLAIILDGDMRGSGESIIKTMNGVDIGDPHHRILSFPINGDLYLYQDRGSSSSGSGSIFMVVLGEYILCNNDLWFNRDQNRVYGTVEFTDGLLS